MNAQLNRSLFRLYFANGTMGNIRTYGNCELAEKIINSFIGSPDASIYDISDELIKNGIQNDVVKPIEYRLN